MATPDGARTLPPSGFHAFGPGPARLHRARCGWGDRGRRGAPEYTFARARADLSTIEALSTDGAIAIVPGVHGDALHGVDLTVARRSGALLLSSSVRADAQPPLARRAARALGIARGLAAGIMRGDVGRRSRRLERGAGGPPR